MATEEKVCDCFFFVCKFNVFVAIATNQKQQFRQNLCVCLFDLGLTSLSTIFQSYRDSVWMWQGAQCSLLVLTH